MAYIWINPVTESMYEPKKLTNFLQKHGYKQVKVTGDWLNVVKEKYRIAVGEAMTAVIDMRCPKTKQLLDEMGVTAEFTVPTIEPILIHCAREISAREDLRGKTVAGPAGTNLHELLVAFLAKADMTIEDVNYVNMSIPDAKAALEGGSIDVALLAGATAYQAKQQGHHLIADGEGLIDAIIAVAVTNEFYEKYPEIIDSLMDAQEEIEEFMREDEDEAFALTAKALDIDVEAVKEMYRYYDFSTKVASSDKSGFQRTADFMYENGMIEKKLDVDILF